ncbi:DNA cytosine methyltransferase [Alcaligenes faecalis]|uniref:DNA cytosine methyltransferase n=1 Tax=Alcaligenes faecalis TaxID=511 RepID=UPI001EF11E6A|nr:DNA (cytosine-5-)-methyltransferase [Alcaligenes faecalis]ULH05361.1 DNA (cytosine-5-)-methyltransferase [Alcaligenes faecalis]
MKKKPLEIKAVDLFCGAGGLSHGLIRAGINVVSGYDIEESCRFAYEHNNSAKYVKKDITKLHSAEIIHQFDGADFSLLAGCAPCQPFSSYYRSKNSSADTRWDLLSHFGRLIEEISPHFVTMENVPGLVDQPVFKRFLNTLSEQKYFVDYRILYCPDYGMAQTRKRLVLVASKIGYISIPEPTHSPNEYLTVADIIKNLPKLNAGDSCKEDPLHRASILSPLNLRRIKASLPGGSWQDWPEDLLAACHKKETGRFYSSVYGRMAWNEPAPTITTQCNGYGNGRFGHPEQNRAISLREAALLQSFPPEYKFFPSDQTPPITSIAKMIGNAVPVRLGEIVGQAILAAARKPK